MSGTRDGFRKIKRTRQATVGSQARDKQEPRLGFARPISDRSNPKEYLERINDRLERLRRKIRRLELDVSRDFGTEVGRGNVPGYSKVNKYGEALDCDSGVLTDIWDGADGITSTDIWVAPTVARVHNLASASAADAAAGTGMRTCRVYGLIDWDTDEVSEDITLNGVTNVATINSYVIIHRIVGLTFGSGGTNAGIVTATAVTDATITAAIQAAEGQTLMAIYGVPSTKDIYVKTAMVTALRSVSTVKVDATIWAKENVDQSDAGFITKERFSLSDSHNWPRHWDPPKSFSGPCIVKIQVDTNASNTQVSAAFDAYLVDS